MTKKAFFLMFFLSCATISVCFSVNNGEGKKEILLRLPLLSEKNAQIISNALDTLSGMKEIEACYELRVLIIAYDNEKISDDSVVMNILNQLKINTTIEKIYSSDIPLIRSKYKITNLRSIDNKIH